MIWNFVLLFLRRIFQKLLRRKGWMCGKTKLSPTRSVVSCIDTQWGEVLLNQQPRSVINWGEYGHILPLCGMSILVLNWAPKNPANWSEAIQSTCCDYLDQNMCFYLRKLKENILFLMYVLFLYFFLGPPVLRVILVLLKYFWVLFVLNSTLLLLRENPSFPIYFPGTLILNSILLLVRKNPSFPIYFLGTLSTQFLSRFYLKKIILSLFSWYYLYSIFVPIP